MSNTKPARRSSGVYPVTLVPSEIANGMTSPKTEGAQARSYSRITAEITRGDKVSTGTVMAFGAVNDAIAGKLEIGQPVRVRVAFDRAPAQGDAKRGGQCMRIVSLIEDAPAAQAA